MAGEGLEETLGESRLDKFIGATVEMKPTMKEGVYGAELALRTGERVSLSPAVRKSDLYDYWVGFTFRRKEYDVNVYDGKFFGESGKIGFLACVYPVSKGTTDTQTCRSIKVRFEDGNNEMEDVI